jgi:hypothetical protein
MVEEVGELELGDGLPEGKLREPEENGEFFRVTENVALAALI